VAKAKKRRAAAPATTVRTATHKASTISMIVALVAVLAFPALVRLRLLDLPLERDEGEYAYAGQLMLQGVPPYELVYNMKFPGTYAAYAVIEGVFGQTATAIRLGLLLVTTLTAILLYFLGKRLFGARAGVIAAGAYALFAIAPESFGLYAHATHFVALFVVAAMLLLQASEAWRLFASGALLALAVLMKQPAFVFVLFALIYVVCGDRCLSGHSADDGGASGASRRATAEGSGRHIAKSRMRDLAMVCAGGIAVAVLTVLALAAAGVLPRFLFWTIQYAREYATSVPFDRTVFLRFAANLGPIIKFAPLLWLLAIAGLWFVPRGQRLFAIGFLAAGFLAAVPGFYFRGHYFLVMFPALALLAGAAVQEAGKYATARIAVAVLAIIVTAAVSFPRLMTTSLEDFTRGLYGQNPFIESIEIANYLREHTQPNDRIAVLGSEPQIYFLSKRKSATGYIYAYPLMEEQPFAAQMQAEMVKQIESAKPKYLVYVGVPESWLRWPKSDMTLLTWFNSGMQSGRWQLEGVADLSEAQTRYVWGDAARAYRPLGEDAVFVYRSVTQPGA
jgi:hypothetical protein